MKNIHSAFQNHVRSKDERILIAKSLQSFKFSSIGRAGSCPKPIAGRDGGTGGGEPTPLQILADQLTLSQVWGEDYAHHIFYSPQIFKPSAIPVK